MSASIWSAGVPAVPAVVAVFTALSLATSTSKLAECICGHDD